MEQIVSRNNSTIAKYSKLLDKKGRENLDLYLCEGENMFLDAIAFKLDIDAVFVREDYFEKHKELFDTVQNKLYIVGEIAFSKLTDTKTSQGIVFAVKKNLQKFDFSKNILVLDRVADSGNVGGLIRSAAAFGFEQVLCIDCADVYSPKSARASSSGLFCVKILQTSLEDATKIFKDNGYLVVTCDLEGKDLNETQIDKKFALVVGNEANGVCEEFKKMKDFAICIKMQNNIESLNACVAGSIIMQKFTNKN